MAGPKWRVKTAEEQIAEHEAKVARAKALHAEWEKTHYFRYKKILRTLRQDTEHQGQLARVAIFKTGTKKENAAASKRDIKQMRKHLDAQFPMENWQLRNIIVPDTWGQYEIQAAYHGLHATEKDAKDARAARFAKAGIDIRRTRKSQRV